MFKIMVLAAAMSCATLAACGPTGGVASASDKPVAAAPVAPPVASAAAAVADATLPPPAAVSPTATTRVDDAAIAFAFDSLDTTRAAVDTYLALKPAFAGTPAARKLADNLDAASAALASASAIQRGLQAGSYREALERASTAIIEAKSAIAFLAQQGRK